MSDDFGMSELSNCFCCMFLAALVVGIAIGSLAVWMVMR